MSDEMIERVARAICCPDGVICPSSSGKVCEAASFREQARAAILAMREPTKEMIGYAYEVMDHDTPPENYRNMIDAALGKEPKEPWHGS